MIHADVEGQWECIEDLVLVLSDAVAHGAIDRLFLLSHHSALEAVRGPGRVDVVRVDRIPEGAMRLVLLDYARNLIEALKPVEEGAPTRFAWWGEDNILASSIPDCMRLREVTINSVHRAIVEFSRNASAERDLQRKMLAQFDYGSLDASAVARGVL